MLVAAGALLLASSTGKTLALGALSQSLLDHFGVEATAAGLDYRPGSLGVTLHAVSVRQSDSGASLPHRATRRRRLLARDSPRVPLAPPARCHQAGSRVGLDNAIGVRWPGPGASRVILRNRSRVRDPRWTDARSRPHLREAKWHTRCHSRAFAVVRRRRPRRGARNRSRIRWVVCHARDVADSLRAGARGCVARRYLAGLDVNHDGITSGGDWRDRAP